MLSLLPLPIPTPPLSTLEPPAQMVSQVSFQCSGFGKQKNKNRKQTKNGRNRGWTCPGGIRCTGRKGGNRPR